MSAILYVILILFISNYFAKLSGTQTAAQVVNNSSSSDNRSFIYNGLGMSYNAFLERLLKDIY